MNLLSRIIIVALLIASVPQAAVAEFVTTEAALQAEQRDAAQNRVNEFLLRADVQAQLVRMGVSPERAIERVASLTMAELEKLDGTIAEAPAGGIAEVVGIVVIVLLVLELLGVTDVFTNI